MTKIVGIKRHSKIKTAIGVYYNGIVLTIERADGARWLTTLRNVRPGEFKQRALQCVHGA